MVTTVYVNENGMDFTFPSSMSLSRAQNSTSGYAVFNQCTVQWTGTNLKYNEGYFIPASGTITSYTLTDASGKVQFSIACKYTIKPSDASFNIDGIVPYIMSLDNVSWYGGDGDDKFIFLVIINL